MTNEAKLKDFKLDNQNNYIFDIHILLWLSIASGLASFFMLDFTTSLITRDDFYEYQLSSLYGDGRFIFGMLAETFKDLFSYDYYFRSFSNFLFGFLGYITFFHLMVLFENKGQSKYIAPFFAVAIIPTSELVFWYDISSLSWAFVLPFIGLYFAACKRYIDGNISAINYLLFVALISFFLMAINQIYIFIIIFTEFFLYLLIKISFKNSIFRSIINLCALILSIVIYFIFINSAVYEWLFMPLRGRSSFQLVPWLTSWDLTQLSENIASMKLFRFERPEPILINIALLTLLTLRRKEVPLLSVSVGLSGLLFLIVFNPFIFLVYSNARVFQTLYVIIWALSTIAVFSILSDMNNKLRNFDSKIVLFVIVLILPLAALERNTTDFINPFIWIAILGFLLFYVNACKLIQFTHTQAYTVLAVILITIQIQISSNHTDRWQRDMNLDLSLVTKFNDVILKNYQTFKERPRLLEFGVIRAETGNHRIRIPATSYNMSGYSIDTYLKNRLMGLTVSTRIVENKELCADIQEHGFQVIESKNGYLAICY